MQAYMDFCRLKAQGSDMLPQFGFLLTSSYAPIRIYRIKAYQQCSTYSCGPNLVEHAQFAGLNTAYLSADCEGSFNVSVVRLEYLNEDNIAVVMKYSTYAEYDVGTGAINGTNSGYQTYWLNPPTMQVSTTVWETSVPASNYATLCPAMQRLPRVGTLGAELINAGVFLLRWAVNAILYTPGMAPIWRAGGACPAPGASHRHSILMNCGQTLFSLDDFFDSLDDANAVIWHSLTVIAQLTAPAGTDAGGVSPLIDLLQGMDQYGYASVDVWSARSSVIGLLQFPVYEQIDKTLAALKESPGSETMVLSGVFKVGTATIAWARFAYKVVSEIALVIAKEVLQGQDQTAQHIWQSVWATLYDLQAEYTSVITDRNLMACGGLRLMFGLDNPWANLLYGTCAMNAEYYASVLRMAMDIFVEIPMVKCVCKDSAGLNARDYVQRTCAPNLPVTIRPRLYMIVNQLQGMNSNNFRQMACDRVVSSLQTTLQGELDPVFEAFQTAADALASLVDYTLTPWDKDAGHCLDFQTDPHVVVLVPEPVDYFAKCADTSLCHSLCGSLWRAFQAANATPVDMPEVTFDTESLFFPGKYDPALAMTNATAVTEIDGSGVCTSRPAGVPADFCVAVAQLSGRSMAVQMYCAPQVPGEGVYAASGALAGYGPQALPGDVMDAAFLDEAASTLGLLLRVGAADAVYLMSGAGLVALPPVPIPSGYRLVRMVSMWPIERGLVADVVVRSFEGTAMVGSMTNFRYELNGNKSAWAQSPIDLSQFGGQYWFTRLAGGQYMLVPKRAGLPVYTLGFEVVNRALRSTGLVPVETLNRFSFQSALTNAVLSARSMHPTWVLAVQQTGWAWLLQLRLDGSYTGVYASVPVSTTLQTAGHCDARSCEGCPDLATNRLCHAYNKCALMNCVGTPVNMKRPLCGLGGVLRSYATVGMQSFRGAWTMYVELLMLVVSLSTRKSAGANIEFPEDEFMGYVCSFKDANAQWWSVVTSALNSALYLGNANVGFMYHGASNVDTNADAVLTITMSTLTNLLHQFSMAPLYLMLAEHQIYICQTNGELALMDVTGFRLRVQSATLSDASAKVVGQCLTVGDATLARYPSGNGAQLGYKVGSMLQNAFNLLLIRQIDPLLHMLDATLAYWSGVLGAMGRLLMAQFAAQCNPPDVYLSDVVKCACGDTPLSITPARAKETWRDYALWCSGTLAMVDGTNNPFVVYNPYSYEELQAKASGMQAYVECASKSYKCKPPSDEVFDLQGVTLLNVLIKCRENFIENRWDSAAYVLFDPAQAYRYRTKAPVRLPADDMGIQACLRLQAAAGASNSVCLDQWLAYKKTDYYLYWAFERLLGAPVLPERVDACLTFSGPAAAGVPEFQNCVDDETQAICTLAGHAWSPTSNNTVPIGQPHAVLYHGRQADSLIMRLYTEAHTMLQTAVDAAIAHWTTNQLNVNAQFFSAEGDVIHQILDCIFMGPYARVDYWPMPACQAGEECLTGPYWSRDTGAGQSRSVDPYTCLTVNSLPYTCGSPGRQSLIRYFVNTFLSDANANTSVFQQSVLAQLRDIKATWSTPNYTTYGCVCADKTQSHTCCAAATGDSPFFPPNLQVNTRDLSPEKVLNSIDAHFGQVYARALQTQGAWLDYLAQVAPGEQAKYDWSGSRRASDEARLNPKKPAYTYGPEEAMSPLGSVESTLWDVCHASLKQVFWTLPIHSTNNTIVFGAQRAADGSITSDPLTFDALPYDGDAGRLEDYIKALVTQAALKSPLFRHYRPRHAPSPSLVCAPDSPPAPVADGFAKYNDYTHQPSDPPAVQVLEGRRLGTFPVYDYRRMALGSAVCPCDWPLADGLCQAPPAACAAAQAVTARTDCLFHPSNASSILAAFAVEWPCPEFELSAHWGLMDPAATEQWLQGRTSLTVDAQDLLQFGRAGARAGGMDTLRASAKGFINPAARQTPLDRARLTSCGAGDRLMGVRDLAQGFVDQLFPMAQGVEESGAAAHCLRYTMEVALLEALSLVSQDSYEASSQAESVARWRRRCGAQLQLLSLCVNLDVFRAPDTSFNLFAETCLHFAPVSAANFYVTPECLVFLDDAFYDPCRCMACVGNGAPLNITYLKGTPACRLRFDPRSSVRAAPVGWWPADSPGAAEANAHLSDPSVLLPDDFSQRLLDTPEAVANTRPGGPPWWAAEGPMAESSQDCDMIADWWPDDWDFPVGYHVTVPCEARDAAYRSFHQAFAYTRTDEAGVPVLTYQHDLLRDGDLVDTNFGVNGLCRSLNWGVDAFVTNTMRYCTRAPVNQLEDYSVYRETKPSPPSAWTEWACTTSHTHLPWPDSTVSDAPNTDTFESCLYSVGTVPNMPPAGSNYYPYDAGADTYDPGPWQEILSEQGWGRGCSDYPLAFCATDADCPNGTYPYKCRGRLCRGTLVSCKSHSDCNGTASKTCEGVCIDQSVECLSHSECSGGKMCTGLGACVTPVITVQNKVQNKDMAFQVSARGGTCPAQSRNFSMLAGSYWAYVDNDLLRLHGLCSYGDWYKYQQTLSNAQCRPRDMGDYWEIDPVTCPYIDLDALVPNVTHWWEYSAVRPQVMYMHPYNCDRDYERLQDSLGKQFVSCAPSSASLRISRQDISDRLAFDQYARMHLGDSPANGNVRIPLAKMNFSSDKKYGFLGIGSVANDAQIKDIFQSCANLDQCSVPPFTVRGKPAVRQMFLGESWTRQNYTADDVYKCGVTGYSEGDHCRLELSVLQMYRFLCVESDSVNARCRGLVTDLDMLCAAVTTKYQAGYATVASNVDALNNLLYAIPVPTDKDTYLNTTDCMQDLYSYLTNRTQLYTQLYWVFDFVLYEISFDWFYQCIVMNHQSIDTSAATARRNQDCQAYRYASDYSIEGYTPRSSRGDDAMTMLRFVRGGYTRTQVDSYERTHLEVARGRLQAIKQSLVDTIYAGEDTSYSRCTQNIKWKVGPEFKSEYRPELRSLINTLYYAGGCEGTWLTDQVKYLRAVGYQFTVNDWWEYVTTPDTEALVVDAGWGGQPSLLETIFEWASTNMRARLANRIMGLNPAIDGLPFTTRTEAFVIDNLMPQNYPDTLSMSWDPAYTTPDAGVFVSLENEDVPHVCLFDNLQDDPRLRGLDTSKCKAQMVNRSDTMQDYLTVCTGSVPCTQCPKYYMTAGVFSCQYYPDMPGYPCNGTSPGCGVNLFNALYNKFYTSYVPERVQDLAPGLLPWFAPEATWGFSFDLTQVLDFLGNIMPNKEQSVMCTIKPEIVNLMECTNPHYLTLKAHVQKYYMRNGSAVVPSDAQLDWPVDSAFLASGAVFSFASTDRDISRTFLKGLFDDKTVCKGDSTSDARVCWKPSSATRYSSMNPWALGYWNPYVECDVDFTGQTQMPTELVNAWCTTVTCPDASNGNPYYDSMPFQSTCKGLFGQKVSKPGVPQMDALGQYIPYNLCHHRLVEDQQGCLHDQALLGGFDGLPVASGDGSKSMTADTPYATLQYKVSTDMYTPSTWEIPQDFMGGLFDQTNPLWAGGEAPFGFLRVPPQEIGIHRIGFQLTAIDNTTISQLDVYKLPLGADGDALDLDAPSMASRPVREWVPTLLAQIAADSAVNRQRAGDFNSLRSNSSSASCPLRRFAFYGSSRPAFAPTVPSPQRAYHLFRGITGRAYAHPTMSQVTTGEFFGKYSTVNGVCFCPLVDGNPQTQCQVRIGDASNMCSLTQTVEALMGAPNRPSYVYHPFTSLKQDMYCQMHLDWPRVPIALRDGSPGPSGDQDFKLASDQQNQRCHVLDRFQPFQFKYQSVPEFPPSGRAAGVHGACQTRRVAQVTQSVLAALGDRRCVRDSLATDKALVRCTGRTGRISVPRLTKLAPPDTVAKTKTVRRTRCDQCTPPPRFETNGGSPMEPESSFGRPFRLSAERMLAKDLREAVCGADQACPLLNRSAWRAGEFMRNFLLRPENLFANSAPPPPRQPAAAPPDDSPRWTDHGWVYCPDRKSLVSGEGCLGSIPRDVWQGSKTSVCPRLVRALSSNGSRGGMTTVPFFDIDNYTQAVNLANNNAKQLVGLANCIAAGNFTCLPKPWAYHPATFVPSNMEWAYQTVLEYYRLVTPGACPMTQDELKLVELNQKFMQDCPANTLRFFQDVLAIVRLVGTDLAYIVSTLFSMGFKLVTLLFAGAESGLKNTVLVARQEIATDWLWLKNQARNMLSGVNDLLLDMVFSTGEIGKVLLNFLTTICDKVNGIYKWILGIWCNFLQKHLPRFLTVMRSAISMIASGFEILQDFMDVVFQGVLPAAFMQKYGGTLFQQALLEKYSQPTNRKKKYLTRVQSSARVFTSTMDRTRAALRKTGDAVTGVGGKFGMALAAGLLAWQAAEDIQGALNYPQNFTLFDFSGVFDGIDNMMDHISDDEICLEYSTAQRYNMSFQLFSCFKNTLLNDPALSNRAATSIAPTLCWANAQISLGQSNLFSCHSGSTCCPDNECATPIVCNACPTPAYAGEARYGCNTLRQQCQCAVPLDAYTPCTANQQCGGSTQCILASLSSTVSYGTIPCAQCVTQNVYCSIPSTGHPGQCTCYTDTALPLALCSDASGTSTRVDGNRLCGYSADSKASDSTWQFALEQLAMVQCARAPTAICSTVWATQSTSVRLAVAIPPLRTSTARRRLLWDDSEDGRDAYAYDGDFEPFGEAEAQRMLSAPGWEKTGAPCAELVRRHQQGAGLGVLERHELHRCAYWRFAGRRTIQALNLTGLEGHETFLLSAEDLATALTDREALLEVITAPWLFVYAALYHPWARPLRAAATVLANSIEQTDWLRKWLIETEDEGPEELLDFVTGNGGMDASEAVDDLLNFSQWQVDFRRRRLIDPRPPVTRASVLQGKTPPPQPRRPRRALLSVISDIRLVQAFSAKVAQSGDPAVPVPQQVAQVWGAGPFVWPPRFDYQNAACPIATALLELTTEAGSVVVLYYVNFDKPLPPIDRSLRGTLPQISWNRTRSALATVADNGRQPATWASSAFHYVTGQILGLSRGDISNFFVGSSRWSLLWTVQSLFQCDLGAAVSCSRHKRDLLMSIVLFVLLYLMVQMLASATGFTFLTSVLFYGAPLILLWYVYGVAPSCFPILPTCLLADLIAAAEYAMPASVSLPPELLCDNQTLANATCLRQCAELGFGSWADTLAFSLCDTDARWCEALGHAGENTSEYLNTVGPLFAPLQSALLEKSQWFLAGNGTAPSRLAAYRICAWVTWVSVLPFLLLLVSLVFAAGSIVLGVVQLGPSFFSLLAQTWAFHRAPTETGRQ